MLYQLLSDQLNQVGLAVFVENSEHLVYHQPPPSEKAQLTTANRSWSASTVENGDPLWVAVMYQCTTPRTSYTAPPPATLYNTSDTVVHASDIFSACN